MGLFSKFKKAHEASDSSNTPTSTTEGQLTIPEQGGTVQAASASPIDDVAPVDAAEPTKRRASWFRRRGSAGEYKAKEKKQSISDSGPYIFAFNPNSGKEELMKNPHWPNEDSWKREQTSGWAMGSMYGSETKTMG